jgi:hypothetical protein
MNKIFSNMYMYYYHMMIYSYKYYYMYKYQFLNWWFHELKSFKSNIVLTLELS